MSPGRIILVAAAAVVGAVAIYLAIQELGESPTVNEPQGPPERGGLRTVGVRIEGNAFVPGNVSLRAGQTVRWTNTDDVVHTVTSRSPGARFDSGRIAPGDRFDYTFKDSGVFRYVCTIHDGMRAKVTVLGD